MQREVGKRTRAQLIEMQIAQSHIAVVRAMPVHLFKRTCYIIASKQSLGGREIIELGHVAAH